MSFAPDTNVKKWLESEAYAKQKAIINKEINEDFKLVIDYKCFKKSPQEKALLATLKAAWKKDEAAKKAA